MASTDNPYIFGDPELDRQRLETQSRLIARYARAHAHELAGDEVHSILDVGCGEGQLGFALQDVYLAAALTGIDRDPVAIKSANERAAREGRAAKFVAGDVQQSLPAGDYDLAFVCLLLMHTQQPAAVLRNAYAVMKPGATLWIIDATEGMGGSGDDSVGDRLFKLFFATLERIGAHPHIMSELPTLLEQAGFAEVVFHSGAASDPFATNKPAERLQVNAAGLGAIYNARQAIAQVNGLPVSQVERMFADLANSLVADPNLPMPQVVGVVTAHKPA